MTNTSDSKESILKREEALDDEGDFMMSDDEHARQSFKGMATNMMKLGVLDRDDWGSFYKAEEEDSKKSFERGQKETITSILDEIDKIQAGVAAKGMNEWKFTLGLLNILAIAYVFGAFPGYFWIVYMAECVFWIAWKLVSSLSMKPLSGAYYFLDFCWVMNILGVSIFFAFALLGPYMTEEIRRQLFMTSFGIASGPVFLAAMALPFVAFVFHDVATMANSIIHVMPAMLMYIIRWQPQTMLEAFPSLFNMSYMKEPSLIPFSGGGSAGSVSRDAIILYFVWFVPYVIWMLISGLKLPRTVPNAPPPKYDTVFHSTWRNGLCELAGTVLWKRPKELSREQSKNNDFEVRDFLVYIAGHAFAVIAFGIFVVGRLCAHSQRMHGVCLCVAIFIVARRGAARYTYYSTVMYGQRIRKHFVLVEDKNDGDQKKEN